MQRGAVQTLYQLGVQSIQQEREGAHEVLQQVCVCARVWYIHWCARVCVGWDSWIPRAMFVWGPTSGDWHEAPCQDPTLSLYALPKPLAYGRWLKIASNAEKPLLLRPNNPYGVETQKHVFGSTL